MSAPFTQSRPASCIDCPCTMPITQGRPSARSPPPPAGASRRPSAAVSSGRSTSTHTGRSPAGTRQPDRARSNLARKFHSPANPPDCQTRRAWASTLRVPIDQAKTQSGERSTRHGELLRDRLPIRQADPIDLVPARCSCIDQRNSKYQRGEQSAQRNNSQPPTQSADRPANGGREMRRPTLHRACDQAARPHSTPRAGCRRTPASPPEPPSAQYARPLIKNRRQSLRIARASSQAPSPKANGLRTSLLCEVLARNRRPRHRQQ